MDFAVTLSKTEWLVVGTRPEDAPFRRSRSRAAWPNWQVDLPPDPVDLTASSTNEEEPVWFELG
jgi:hypothetical protein